MFSFEHFAKRLAMLLVTCLLVGCAAEQPDLYMSNDTECSAPCWHSIVPGKSTVTEAESVLRSLSFVSELDFDTSNQEVTSACWQFTASVAYGCTTFKNAVLQNLRVRPKDLHLEQIAVQLMLKADDSPPFPAAGLSSSESNAIIATVICCRRSDR
jgi:hypothetical protein